jgi:hypothetical protein
MVHRIIVRSDDSLPRKIDARWNGLLIPTAGIVVTAYSRRGRELSAFFGRIMMESVFNVLDERYVAGAPAVAIAIFFLFITITIVMMRLRRRRVVVGFAISFDQSGVQLENVMETSSRVSFSRIIGGVTSPASSTTYESTHFIAYQEIKDCVVTEIILVHTVENALVLRRHPPPRRAEVANTKNDDMVTRKIHHPVDIFPLARFTYAECLQLRQEINNALKGRIG